MSPRRPTGRRREPTPILTAWWAHLYAEQTAPAKSPGKSLGMFTDKSTAPAGRSLLTPPPAAPMSSSEDLRARAARLTAPAESRPALTAPVDTGERLATLERGESEHVRVTWAEYEGKPFLNIRLWTKAPDGQWWPDKAKGITVRVRELGAFAEGVAAALDRLEQSRAA